MNWWQYLMLVNIYLLLFYVFYHFLLRRETFFHLNRVYLVTAQLLSFLIPVIQADWIRNLFITQKVQYTLYGSPVFIVHYQPAPVSQITVGEVLLAIYLTGSLVLLIRFIRQIASLRRSISHPHPAEAYSFFRKIKIGNDLAGNESISAHEQVHAVEWHSADIILTEAVTIVNWFNPAVYFYRHAVKHIHEFIADRQVINSGADKTDYALLLLNQTFGAPANRLVNPFFNSSLVKQRIIMLQKNKSHRMALIKYGFSAPLFILMLVLSSATLNNSKTVFYINKKTENLLLSPVASQQSDAKPQTLRLVKDVNTTLLLDTSQHADKETFTSVEDVPVFPGGIVAFGEFLGENIRYPADMRRQNIQGRVIVTFIVEKDGSLSDVHVVRSLSASADAEAIRVLRMSPKWTPGRQNGHTVRVIYSVPISFTLQDEKGALNTGAANQGDPTAGGLAAADTGKKTDTGKQANSHLKGYLEKPLYIIDGKETTSLSAVNPNDIESMSVLKDKQAVAEYGKKGAYGVIIVTTKKHTVKLKPAGN